MKRNKLFLCVLLFAILMCGKTFSQNQTFSDGLSIVYKFDFADTLSSSRPLGEKYNHVTSYNGKYILYANYRCGVVDAAGNVIIPESNQLIIRNGDVFEVRNKDRHGLIDSKGQIIGEYDHLIKMSDQLYRARKNKKLGVVDIHGNEIIPFEYEYIGNISDNKTIKIRKENKYGIVNEHGSMIVQCDYDFINEDNASYRVRKDNKWGVVDSVGKMIVPCEYEMMGAFENGVSKVMKNGYLGYIDQNNQVILDFKYVYINPFVNGVAEACECEQFIMASNQTMINKYKREGYVLLETPTRIGAMCKNPKYSELTIENLTSK